MYKILPIENIIGEVIRRKIEDFNKLSPTHNVSYAWGDQQELVHWIMNKDKEIDGYRAFGFTEGGGVSKYPLIWLVSPLKGRVLPNGKNLFYDLDFIICSNTEVSWSNERRERETMPILVDLANLLIDVLIKDPNTSIPRNKDGEPSIKFLKSYNYPLATIRNWVYQVAESELTDIIDAVKLSVDITINSNCLDMKTSRNQSDCGCEN